MVVSVAELFVGGVDVVVIEEYIAESIVEFSVAIVEMIVALPSSLFVKTATGTVTAVPTIRVNIALPIAFVLVNFAPIF